MGRSCLQNVESGAVGSQRQPLVLSLLFEESADGLHRLRLAVLAQFTDVGIFEDLNAMDFIEAADIVVAQPKGGHHRVLEREAKPANDCRGTALTGTLPLKRSGTSPGT